jgi:plastocyanin
MPAATTFQIVVGVVGSLTGALCAIAYFRSVRLERPPIGTFNSRDVCALGCFIVLLPLLYVKLPADVLTVFIVLTFWSALTIALRPLVPRVYLMVGIPAALLLAILQTRYVDSMAGGLQVYWAMTSIVVLIAAVGVSNLYVQGGLSLRQIAWFTLFLGVYDIVFTKLIPLTPELAVALQGRPLDPSVGFAAGAYNANVGLGDLLVFCLYATAAYRGFGRRGAMSALVIIVIFGAIAPSVAPLLAPGLFGTTAAAFVPVQTVFGPAAFLNWRWLTRTSHERTLMEWLRSRPIGRARPAGEVRRGLAVLAPPLAAVALGWAVLTGAATTQPAKAALSATRARPGVPAAGLTRVVMHDVAFSAHIVVVRRGATIEWVNEDPVPHNVVATSGASFRSSLIPRGGTFQFQAARSGSITYVCTLHQGMTGRITVLG